MNSTNRPLNRALLLLCGFMLLGLGGVGIGIGLSPLWRENWASTIDNARTSLSELVESSRAVHDGPVWLPWMVPLAALFIIVLLLAFVVRQGRGRTNLLSAPGELRLRDDNTRGTVVLGAGLARDTITEALAQRDELLNPRVATYRVRGQSVVKITVSPRRGIAPERAQAAIEEIVSRWDAAYGRELPVLIGIENGVRRALASPRTVR